MTKNNRNRFYMYFNTRPAIELLPPEEAISLVLALYDCAEGKPHIPLANPAAEAFYNTFAPTMEQDLEAYLKACEAKSAGRKRGWAESFPKEGPQEP